MADQNANTQAPLGGTREPLQLLWSAVLATVADDRAQTSAANAALASLVFDASSTWGVSRPASEEFPSAMFRHLTLRPADSLRELLHSVDQVSRTARASLLLQDVGTVRQVGDGVASVWGLPEARTDELLAFRDGVMGLVMNLDAEWTDCILLGSDEGIQGGDLVNSTGQRLMAPVGERLLGRVINPLGQPIDSHPRLFVDERRPIEREALGVVDRQAVSESLHTGIKAIDAIIPIGRGQRELIIGDRQTGKTSIALDTIINQKDQGVLCVYVSIGQRKSSALEAIRALELTGAMEHTVVVVAAPDDPPALLYLAPYVGCTIAEEFLDRGHDVLIVYDDLTKHADAHRELSLLLRRPPGREAYPGDVFYLHARLLERACRRSDALGGGSITALPIVETRRSNIAAYIPTNLISITDGQIYLNPDLFNQNIKPAIDIGLSVSRVGGAAQSAIMRSVSGQLKLTLAQYEEVAHFARFGADLDRATQQQINRGIRLREALKQPAYRPLSLAEETLFLYAVDRGYADGLPVEEIASYEQALWRLAEREFRSVIRRIEEEQCLDDALERDIQTMLAKLAETLS
jgi:F-type H+-transporting ATPase subunit alpha